LLLKNADLALYRAKSEGRRGYRFFEAAMDDQARRRRSLEVDLRNAIGRDEFVLHYQPIVDASSGAVCGVETLARWPHPQFGMIPPDQFISLAEEIGAIDALGEWILRRACADAAAWPAGVKLAVNLSPVQFRKGGLVEMVRDTLARTGLPASRLELEVTESVLLQKSEGNIETLRALKQLGVSIVLDDFGTGYSSLSYLRMFAFDKIKIDKSFVQELGRSDCAAIVCAITALARALNVSTTAEGVETPDQLVLIRSAGCNLAQGYLFARPCPADRLDLSKRVLRTADSRVA
jgi:EAL domain-containing protein (putative c-di-GMP-specific phosphodiesterase class I)